MRSMNNKVSGAIIAIAADLDRDNGQSNVVWKMLTDRSSEKGRNAIHLASIAEGSDEDFANILSTFNSARRPTLRER